MILSKAYNVYEMKRSVVFDVDFLDSIKQMTAGGHRKLAIKKFHTKSSVLEKETENNAILALDTTLFQIGRTVFLRMHISPKDTTLQLNELRPKGCKFVIVTLDEYIKFAHQLKADIFIDDSIKIPDITIRRGKWSTVIGIIKIKNFHIDLVEGEFIIRFDEHFDNMVEPHQYKFKIP
ncbi:MAG: hypothetical protein LBB74_06225 [Chitinispirillales bacterium]|jgi:hypothetical protein|nr:hypothetical protein [Chitinispirillales bacterium]